MMCYCQRCKHNSELSCTINTQINFEGKCAYCEEREIKQPTAPALNYCVKYWRPCENATYDGKCGVSACSKMFE